MKMRIQRSHIFFLMLLSSGFISYGCNPSYVAATDVYSALIPRSCKTNSASANGSQFNFKLTKHVYQWFWGLCSHKDASEYITSEIKVNVDDDKSWGAVIDGLNTRVTMWDILWTGMTLGVYCPCKIDISGTVMQKCNTK